MIKANEIRLGNWLFDPDGKEKQFDYSDLVSLPITTLHFNPIHLTREVLEKCGFEAFPWGWVKKSKSDFGVRLGLTSFYYEVSGNMPVKLKSLHQLQNLYYALTGEELEFKEPVNQ